MRAETIHSRLLFVSQAMAERLQPLLDGLCNSLLERKRAPIREDYDILHLRAHAHIARWYDELARHDATVHVISNPDKVCFHVSTQSS